MNIYKAVLPFLIALTVSAPVSATTAHDGLISHLYVQPQGVAIIAISNVAGDWPSCATTQRYAIRLDNAGGQAMYSALLTAVKTNAPITIRGSSTCANWGDSEDVSYLDVKP